VVLKMLLLLATRTQVLLPTIAHKHLSPTGDEFAGSALMVLVLLVQAGFVMTVEDLNLDWLRN
jgi:hypothetical protein